MYHSRLEPTIDDLQAQIDRLNRTIREWREQQAPQAPAGDKLSQLGDRGAEILTRWEATDQRYSQAVNEIESRLAEWGAMESRLHRDALERVRAFERTMQGEWQALRQMHEEPLKQLQEQAAALGETCVAAANLSLRGYERAEARLVALENDLRAQLTDLSKEVHAALAEVRRAALPPAAPAEPFQLESVMRLHEELRNAAPFPSENALPAQPFADSSRDENDPGVISAKRSRDRFSGAAVEQPRTIDVKPVEAPRAAEVAETIEATPVEAVPRPVEVTRPVEAARSSDPGEPVVMWPRPVLAQMPSAATAPAVAPDVKVSSPFAIAADASAAPHKAGPTRLPDSAFPLNEVTADRRARRRTELLTPSPTSRPNMIGRGIAAGIALAVIVVGIVAVSRMPAPGRPDSLGATTVGPTSAPAPGAVSSEASAPAVSNGPSTPVAPPPAAVAPLPAPDSADVAPQHTIDILASPDAVRLLLVGVGAAEGATAQVMWSRAQGMVLSASRLPALPEGMTYRLALQGAVGNIPVTNFTPDATGRARLVAANPADMPRPVHGAVITIESAQAGAESTGIVALERGAR